MIRSPSRQDASQPGETGPIPEDAGRSGPAPTTDEVVPLTEETVDVDKRERVTGKVQVRTVTDTVEELARATLQTESVEVTRGPVDRVVDAPPSVRTENDVVIVPDRGPSPSGSRLCQRNLPDPDVPVRCVARLFSETCPGCTWPVASTTAAAALW